MSDTVKLIAATQNADSIMGYCARVSNPANQDNPDVAGLLRYCATHGHWSVFEMANAVLEINTTRDIARQLLRHRSFSFQEFSQRYADASQLGDFVIRECRLQDAKNRQNSIPAEDAELAQWWRDEQYAIELRAKHVYEEAMRRGIAKEQARAVLPEGMTPSRLYVNGTIRSWIHWLQVRLGNGTQKEHSEIAGAALPVLRQVAPVTFGAIFPEPANA